MKKPTGYSLSRKWFDWCFDNTEKVTPCHTAMYFFIIEHWNRMGWKETFGLPMSSTKDAIGIKNFRTYTKTFNDLVEWGFIKVVQRSKNQYTANIIAIVQNTTATTKALNKALHGHEQKQRRGTYNGTVYIDKPITLEQVTIHTPANGIKKSSQKKESIPLAEAAATFDFSAYPELKETALKFVAFAEKELHEVMTMKYPLTIEQICSILQKYTDRSAITSVLRDMENHAKLKKSYVSAYKTLGSWMEVRERNKINV